MNEKNKGKIEITLAEWNRFQNMKKRLDEMIDFWNGIYTGTNIDETADKAKVVIHQLTELKGVCDGK